MATTTTKMERLSFQWDIKDYDDCDLVSNDFFNSPSFSTNNPTLKSDWELRLYPSGSNIGKTRTNLLLHLLRLDSGSIFHTKHSISLLNRIRSKVHTESCSTLCVPSKVTDSTEQIMEAANIVEIKKNVIKFLDGGVLSILCEIEIYDKNEEIEVAVQEKLSHMRGTSWVIRNMHSSINVTITGSQMDFLIPFGKLFLRFKGIFAYHDKIYKLELQIIDEVHTEITEVPITIVCEGSKSTWNIHRSLSRTITSYNSSLTFQISTKCVVESRPDAVFVAMIPCARKVQSDYRNMFSQSEGSDISIVVDGKILQVHKSVLSNRCPVFAAMFSHEWQEQTSQTVTIKDFDYKTILALIEFIYFGGCDDDYGLEEEADPVKLLKAAHMYQLDHLKNKCEQRLCKSMEKNNVASFISLAEIYDLPTLKIEAFAFIINNRSTIMK